MSLIWSYNNLYNNYQSPNNFYSNHIHSLTLDRLFEIMALDTFSRYGKEKFIAKESDQKIYGLASQRVKSTFIYSGIKYGFLLFLSPRI